MSDPRVRAALRAREGLRRGSELAGLRVIRGLGEPALFAVTLSAVVASMFFALGVVTGDALGLSPLVYAVAGLFLAVTMATYVEGTSLHIERGGASTLARYAFDELWSFIAGWAILLDYLIVMAAGAVAITDYLAVYVSGIDDGIFEVLVAGLALVLVATINVRGVTARRLRTVLRVSLFSIVVLAAVSIVAFVQFFDAGAVVDSVELGSVPDWEDAIFALGVACVALIGVEAASGLAGEVRVGRRGLRRVVVVSSAVALLLFVCVSSAALMAQPVQGGATPLGGRFIEAPGARHRERLREPLARRRGPLPRGGDRRGDAPRRDQQPDARPGAARVLACDQPTDPERGWAPERAARDPVRGDRDRHGLAFGLSIPHDIEFLAGTFAFGAMIAFAIAHLSLIVLRFREPGRASAFRVPFGVTVRGAVVPLPAVFGLVLSVGVWISVVALHEGARIAGGVWMVGGVLLYVVYRRTGGKPLRQRFTIPAEALQEREAAEYGSILVPVFGEEVDDEIVGTAGRLAAEQDEDGEGGAVLEALYVFEIPMSLPIDARVDDERVRKAKAVLARAKEVGEEYEGVEVATAMVRGRTAGQAIVSEARRRGVEAIVLAAEEPTRVRGGAIMGGRGRVRDRFVGDTTRYVVEKAPCRVILTAPPAGEEGTREGVLP